MVSKRSRQGRPWHLRPSCAPPNKQTKIIGPYLIPTSSQQNRLTNHKAKSRSTWACVAPIRPPPEPTSNSLCSQHDPDTPSCPGKGTQGLAGLTHTPTWKQSRLFVRSKAQGPAPEHKKKKKEIAPNHETNNNHPRSQLLLRV